MFDKPLDELKKTLSIASDDKSYSSFLIAFFGVIPALIVWFYRDLNNYRERETSLRNVMFSEHKQLVEWATTEAKKDKSESNESTNLQITEINPSMIQIAGIYQLAPFLKDHHANLYQRSTLETLRAIVNAGRPKWEQWVKDCEAWILGDKKEEEPEKPVLTAAERAVHAVLRENPILFYHKNFNAKDFNLAGFDGSGLVLIGCDLNNAMLVGADLVRAILIASNLTHANLKGANLIATNLISVNLSNAKLAWSNLVFSRLDYANLEFSNLSGSCFAHTDFSFSILLSVKFNDILNFGRNGHVAKSAGIFQNALTNEPKLIFRKNESIMLICEGAISIADERVKHHPFYELARGKHESAIKELKEKGLAPTTQASLAAEHKELS